MELENLIENGNLIINFFGYFPKFHDSEIMSMTFETSKPGYDPTIVLSLLINERGQCFEIILEFINVVKNSMCNFSGQNSVYEMNFSKQEEYIKCVIDPNCGLSAEILCEKIRFVSLRINNTEHCFKVKMVCINNNNYKITSLKELQELFSRFDNVEYKEVAINGYNDTSLLVVMNKNNSMCLFFTDADGGDSYHIYNPNGNSEKYETFIISNGQADEYEEINLIDNQVAYDIIQYYFETGRRYGKVTWELD